MEPRINLWLHLLAFASYAGATFAVLVVCLPLADREQDPQRRSRLIADILRIYDPLVIAALGVIVMTGAFNLTTYKAALRQMFFERLGGVLGWKLFLSFLLINLAAYMAFGIGHRIVRRMEEEVDPIWLESMLRRFRMSAIIALILTAAITWLALDIAHLAAGVVPAPVPSI